MKKTALSTMFMILLMTSLGHAEDKGKIAVAAEETTAAAQVSGVAARSPYFLIFDPAGALLEAVENPYRETGRKAGVSVVPFLAQKRVTTVVAGKFGKNMIQAMKERNIKYMEFQGNTEAALQRVLETGQ
jgi:predicted Fe-Mo cluster-binding NifX family protein